MLKTETDTPEMEERIEAAFAVADLVPEGAGFSSAFEHGQWWIIADSGATWSVADVINGIDGFGFELISEGA